MRISICIFFSISLCRFFSFRLNICGINFRRNLRDRIVRRSFMLYCFVCFISDFIINYFHFIEYVFTMFNDFGLIAQYASTISTIFSTFITFSITIIISCIIYIPTILAHTTISFSKQYPTTTKHIPQSL